MSRFFFDFRQGAELTFDKVGLEYPSVEAAYLEAMDAGREMFGDLLAERQDPRNCAFEIRGETGEVLFQVPFLELLETCHDAPPRPALGQTSQRAIATQARSRRLRNELRRELQALHETLKQATALLAGPVS